MDRWAGFAGRLYTHARVARVGIVWGEESWMSSQIPVWLLKHLFSMPIGRQWEKGGRLSRNVPSTHQQSKQVGEPIICYKEMTSLQKITDLPRGTTWGWPTKGFDHDVQSGGLLQTLSASDARLDTLAYQCEGHQTDHRESTDLHYEIWPYMVQPIEGRHHLQKSQRNQISQKCTFHSRLSQETSDMNCFRHNSGSSLHEIHHLRRYNEHLVLNFQAVGLWESCSCTWNEWWGGSPIRSSRGDFPS